MKTKAALYARVSLKDGRQDVENQLRLLREYAEREGLQVVKEYVDHGTGGNGNPIRRNGASITYRGRINL
jgi:predicted site-specific integrase-resolvase